MLRLNPTPPARRCRRAWTGAAALDRPGPRRRAVRRPPRRRRPAEAKEAKDAPKPDAKKPAEPAAKGETLDYSGNVTDKDTGKPIAGATVVVRRSLFGDPEEDETNPVIQETKHTTDADGKYTFTIPPEQSAKRYLYIELDVEHPDYAPQKGFGYALSMIRKNEKLGGRPFFESVDAAARQADHRRGRDARRQARRPASRSGLLGHEQAGRGAVRVRLVRGHANRRRPAYSGCR